MNMFILALAFAQAAAQSAVPAPPAPAAAPAQLMTPVSLGNSSLYTDRNPSLSMFQDQKARQVGDILTIQVVETATATNSANTNTKKDGSSGVPMLFGADKSAIVNLLAGAGNLAFNGQGSTTRSGQLQAAISVRVSEVLPNSDLQVEGAKEVMINNERQTLRIRGIVRSRDITPGNVILSTSIANMDVRFDGKGVVSDINKPGWLYRFFSKVMPF